MYLCKIRGLPVLTIGYENYLLELNNQMLLKLLARENQHANQITYINDVVTFFLGHYLQKCTLK